MTRRLFWKLCLIIAIGTISLFYIINIINSQTEEGMSYLAQKDRQQILDWGAKAEELYITGKEADLEQWLKQLAAQQQTWVGVIETNLREVAGTEAHPRVNDGVLLGRDVSWKIHLYFSDNPIMEVTFSDRRNRFLVELPDRMRPGLYLGYITLALQIILPMSLLIPLTFVLYNHIMSPLRQLERATRSFTEGKYSARVAQALGSRNDELTQLAKSFDLMAARTSDLITSQQQLISDLSHELRAPLTRLDVAIGSLEESVGKNHHIERINRESQHIRKLVEDTLTLAWLENEQMQSSGGYTEDFDLVDLLDVLLADAKFEFSDRLLEVSMPENALIYNSNHRAVGQAIENILRNAFRYTPVGQTVSVSLLEDDGDYVLKVCDQGSGVAENLLSKIFQPFYRVEGTKGPNGSFGLGLALAKRQLESVNAWVIAQNIDSGGLVMLVRLPKGAI